MKILSVLLLILFFVSSIKCDLPIHALMGDVYGIWKINQTKKLNDKLLTCGGGIPNSNEGNLNSSIKYYKSYLEKNYGDLEEFKINLTIEKIKIIDDVQPRNNWTYLAVKDLNDNVIGSWTMVYDEGFEIRLQGKKYFGFFKYELSDSVNCPKSLEDNFILDEDTKKCYVTNPTKLHMGWVLDEKIQKDTKKKILHWGCFYAEKDKNINAKSYTIYDSSTYMNNYYNTNGNVIIPSNRLNYTKFHVYEKPKDHIEKTNLRNINENKYNKYACKNNDFSNLKINLTMPKSFTWGDPYSDENFDEIVNDQKECGSCYSIASTYSLEKRFEIQFLKKYQKHIQMPKLSYKSVVNCSPYNQGCSGGYPYLVGKQMYEFGVASEECKNNNLCEDKCHRYYASDYHYINGCYECTNEYQMMKEIIINGPIVAAINANGDFINLYHVQKNFIFHKNYHNQKICDIINNTFNGWEYTNHAVNIVGWGEDFINNQKIKFWIIRNTWGNNWGYNGYIKFQRGNNLRGIESQAIFIDPDFNRGHAKQILDQF